MLLIVSVSFLVMSRQLIDLSISLKFLSLHISNLTNSSFVNLKTRSAASGCLNQRSPFEFQALADSINFFEHWPRTRFGLASQVDFYGGRGVGCLQ